MKTSLLYPKTHSETLLLLPAVPFPGWTWKELLSGHFRWWLHYRMAWRILPLFSPLPVPADRCKLRFHPRHSRRLDRRFHPDGKVGFHFYHTDTVE